MDIRNVEFVDERPIDLYDLKVGELFIEDTYPEVYRVDRIEDDDHCGEVCSTVFTTDLTNNVREIYWFYNKAYPGYAPTLFRVRAV